MMLSRQTTSNTQRFGFLLLPDYSMESVSAVIESLRHANRLSGRELYQWSLLAQDPVNCLASNGLSLQPVRAIEDTSVYSVDFLLICGSQIGFQQRFDKKVISWVDAVADHAKGLGSLGSGFELLARTGLLNGYACSVHQDTMPDLLGEYPEISFSTRLFTFDRDRFSCLGGQSAIDMLMQFLRQQQGHGLASLVVDTLICDRVRDAEEAHACFERVDQSPALTEALALMQNNLQEVLSIEEIAGYTGVTRRHLERHFQKYLSITPRQYYMKLRLQRADKQIRETGQPFFDIAKGCGFQTLAHFTKSYRELYGMTPTTSRSAFRSTLSDILPMSIAV